MANEIKLPKFGETMEEGTIVSWEKQPGDAVAKGEVLLKIESDKATLDVESEQSGVLLKIVAQEGDIVPCGQTIGYLGEPGEQM